MIILCIYSPVYSVCSRLVYSLLPGVPVCQPCLALSCPALMSTLKTVNLSFILVSVFLVPPCCVHRDRRPDQNSKRRPFSTFCFPFLKVLLFCSCLFVRQVHGLPLPQVTPPSAAPSSPPSAALPSPPAVNVASPPLTQAHRPAADSSSLVLARSVVLSLVVLTGTVLI